MRNVSSYGWSPDYVKDREAIVNQMTREKIEELAGKYLDTEQMIWLVVGDARTQLNRLKQLGLGDPVLINDMNGPEK